MPVRPCPICGTQTVRWLEASSAQAYVNYYRCEHCGHVWNVPKDKPQAEPNMVTRVVADDDSSTEDSR